ncbi:MAG: OB-fold nucleic acid binding domain-containing protein, partial [Pontimonas sp.]
MSEEVELDVEDVVEQQRVRMVKRETMLDAGVSPYPVTLPITHSIAQVREKYGELGPEEKSGVTVGVSGRVMHLRVTGKLAFIALQDGQGTPLQAMVSFGEVGEESFERLRDWVDLGDHLFVSGEVITSKRGELSVWVSEWQIA